MSAYDDNLKEVDAWYAANEPATFHTLEMSNVAEYAQSLNDRFGYYVFNDSKAHREVGIWLRKVIDAGLPINVTNIRNALDASGYKYVGFLQSLTSQMRPPVKDGEGLRRAHPGAWADVTSILKASYHHQVDSQPEVVHPG